MLHSLEFTHNPEGNRHADRITAECAQLTPAAGDRHDEANMAAIES
jgi:hypothetical protein